MSELYRIEQESLTAIADEVRTLSGTTELMSPDAIATNIEDANAEVEGQTGLLAQLAAALEGKAGGGSETVETCTINITVPTTTGVFYMKYDGGEYAEVCETVDSSISIHNVVCNQNIFFVVCTQTNLVINTTGGVTGSFYGTLDYNIIFTAMCTSVSGGTINITEENIFPV